ncbi:hypothetical protein BVY03_04715 [bacterium K02(2017)]|nr:hypothetical protein BVY03_04715 [bacterium K02(2017)]
MESPQTLNRDQFELQVETSFSNVFEFDNISNTTMNIDMEIWRTALTLGYGLNEKLDVKLELPFISTTGGFLDAFIEGYHDLFKLPYSGRGFVQNNQTSFEVIHQGSRLINHQAIALGLSDVRLRFKYLLSDHFNWPFKFAIAPYLKIPTGQSGSGLGSGQFDIGLSLLAQKSLKRFHITSHIGYVLLGKHRFLDAIIGHGFISFGQSLRFQILDGFSIITQLSGNTSAFNNVNTRDLRRIVLDLNVGFAGEFTLKKSIFDEFFYQWSMSEDVISSGPSVDFSILFLAGVRY